MKKWAAIISIVGLVFVVSGCLSDCIVATRGSRMTLVDGRPETDNGTGLVSYYGQRGNMMQINRDDVSQIIEH